MILWQAFMNMAGVNLSILQLGKDELLALSFLCLFYLYAYMQLHITT